MTFLFFFSLLFSILYANPSGYKVIEGKATVESTEDRCRIEAADKTIIHWNDFSIEKGQTTEFIQDTNTSVVLNRVVGN